MAFDFGGITTTSKKQVLNLRLLKDVVLVDKSAAFAPYDYCVIILSDEAYNSNELKGITLFLEKNRITRYKIISSLNCYIRKDQIKDDQKSGLIDFYRNNSSNFMSYIDDGDPVVTVGSALYALLRADNLYPDHFHQKIFGKSSFWYSPTQTKQGNWIFPIDSFQELFAYGFASRPVDSYKTKLAQIQLKHVLAKKIYYPPRYATLTKVFIDSTERFIEEVYEAHKHLRGEPLAYDLETSGLDFTVDEIGCLSLSFDGVKGYYVPWKYVDKDLLSELLSNNIQIGANLKFDIKFLWKQGVKTAHVDDDVVVLGHVLDESRSNSLKALAYLYSEYGGYDRPLDEYKRKTGIDNYLDIPEDILWDYAVMDALVTWRVFKALQAHIHQLDEKYPNEKGTGWTMHDYYKKIRIPSVNLYARFEYRGVYIDVQQMDTTQQFIEKRLAELQKEMAEAFSVPITFNFANTTDLGNLLRDRGWESMGENKSGGLKVADEQLELWGKDHKEVKLIQEMRTLNVFLNTFIGDEHSKGWRQHLRWHEEDNSWRIHANYNAMGTESGRTRCSEPNMMNIPSHGPLADMMKKVITVPDPNEYYLVTVDYSALQLRLAAVDGDDQELRRVFSSKKADVHSATGYNLFCRGKLVDVEEVYVEQDGITRMYLGGQIVKTARGEVFARDLVETDEIL